MLYRCDGNYFDTAHLLALENMSRLGAPQKGGRAFEPEAHAVAAMPLWGGHGPVLKSPATDGFLGVVAVLVWYDLIRRTTCGGDFLGLGGPGFTKKMPNGDVMTPQCKKIVKHQKVVRVRG